MKDAKGPSDDRVGDSYDLMSARVEWMTDATCDAGRVG
jgi:hypothetical protein